MDVTVTMDQVIDVAIDYIQQGLMDACGAIDSCAIAYDLDGGERRQLIYFMAQKGYRYDS